MFILTVELECCLGAQTTSLLREFRFENQALAKRQARQFELFADAKLIQFLPGGEAIAVKACNLVTTDARENHFV